MAVVRGILGQAAPAATTLTDLYTGPSVPDAKDAIGRVIITNRDSSSATFRIALAPLGAADAPSQQIAFDKAIAGNDTGSTIAFMVGSTDVIRVFASNGNLSFTFTGIEQDS